eukprot:1919881-Alexandrium_andersonii.AAC.1
MSPWEAREESSDESDAEREGHPQVALPCRAVLADEADGGVDVLIAGVQHCLVVHHRAAGMLVQRAPQDRWKTSESAERNCGGAFLHDADDVHEDAPPGAEGAHAMPEASIARADGEGAHPRSAMSCRAMSCT